MSAQIDETLVDRSAGLQNVDVSLGEGPLPRNLAVTAYWPSAGAVQRATEYSPPAPGIMATSWGRQSVMAQIAYGFGLWVRQGAAPASGFQISRPLMRLPGASNRPLPSTTRRESSSRRSSGSAAHGVAKDVPLSVSFNSPHITTLG